MRKNCLIKFFEDGELFSVERTDGTFYDRGHVVVLVLGETATEDNVLLLRGKCPVIVGKRIVALVVDRIVRLHPRFPFRAVLPADNRLWTLIDSLAEHLEMLVLDDSRVWNLPVGIVHDGIALIVRLVDDLGLEPHSPEVEMSEPETEVFVNLSGEDDLPRLRGGVPFRHRL